MWRLAKLAGNEMQVHPDVAAAGGITKMVAHYSANFGRVAPKHIDPEAFVGLAVAYVARDPKLLRAAEANPASLFLSLRTCASLGHMVGPDSFSLVPFNNRRAPGGVEVVGIESYKGVVQRMFRSGGVSSVHTMLVREKDPVWRPGRGDQLPAHEWDPDASDTERGWLRAVYAWAKLRDSQLSTVVVLNRHDVAKYRAVSKAGESFWGAPWPDEGTWTGAMWRKTALHRLEPYVPNSAAFLWEFAAANAAGLNWQGVPNAPVTVQAGEPMEDIHDAEIVADKGSEGVAEATWPPVKEPPA